MSNSIIISLTSIQDLLEGTRRWRQWLLLGWFDFLLQHRRTVIGPFWQSLLIGVWVAGLSIVFSSRFQLGYENYIPYVALGLAFWNFMSTSLTEGGRVFINRRNIINNINIPLSLHVYRFLTTNALRLAFQFLVFLVLLPFFPVPIGLNMLWVIPGLAAMFITSIWVVLLISIIGTRYRDTSFAISSVMRFLFFTTPVFWMPKGLGDREYIAHWNPFTHYLEVVRTPLLGEVPSMDSWIVVGSLLIAGWTITFITFKKVRPSIVFWL